MHFGFDSEYLLFVWGEKLARVKLLVDMVRILSISIRNIKDLYHEEKCKISHVQVDYI